MPRSTAFTLVELLVVVSVITVLLAMLTPALDRAIYQADLARCAAQLKGVASGATAYAVDFKRYFPHRTAMVAGNRQPLVIARGGNDDRPKMRGHIAIKGLIDPLTGPYPIDSPEAPAAGNVYASYSLWFGFGYDGHQAMRKLGDRFEWTDSYNTPVMRHRFDVLATDFDFTGTLARTINSHPDHSQVLQRLSAAGEDSARSYYARWEEAASRVRGGVDMNYAYAGGHVVRLDAVSADDPRTAAVPYEGAATNWSVYLLQLPRP